MGGNLGNLHSLKRREGMFKVGEMAVYPAHGVGIIESIESREISGNKNNFYILRLLSNGMTIMVPTDTASSVGLREVIPSKEIPRVYRILKERDIEIDNQAWNRRYREYMEKIKTGSVFEIATVLRDLYLLKSEKDLSFGERRMLDTARSLLIKELSVAKKSPEAHIENDLRNIFSGNY
jgi:CarD family transcriptional regulator